MKNAQIEVFNTNEIYNFKTDCFDSDLKLIYEKIENIFKDLLNKYSKLYSIENSVFYYDNRRYCSSSATNIGNSLNIIKLSCAYPVLMNNM